MVSLRMKEIRFQRLTEEAQLPIKGTPLSAGFDLYAAEEVWIGCCQRKLISTGLNLSECPEDVYLRIAPRSGKSVKGFDIGAGVVDSDYRGPVKILYINNTNDHITVEVGDRIAQMIPERIRTDLTCVIEGEENSTNDQFLRAQRGEGGFGST